VHINVGDCNILLVAVKALLMQKKRRRILHIDWFDDKNNLVNATDGTDTEVFGSRKEFACQGTLLPT
jgi:hypothetical protein